MKAKVLFSFLVSVFFVVGVYAKAPETTTFSNIQNTENGSLKEFTTFKTNTSEPVQKSTYKYDLTGNILEKVVYVWTADKGWLGSQKLEYTYGEEYPDKPKTLSFREWNKQKSDWSEKQKVIMYSYNEDGSTSISERII